MKRPAKLALWISSVFVLIASGLTASIAWFEMNRYQVDVGVSGSVVEDYFHCGHGTVNDPFVITRPIHYYHLVEFFQRETVLPIGNEQNVNFGSDYLYFQVGYDLDNDGDYEVYSYDDLGIYQGTDQSPSYSTSLNMAYYSGDNALLPIGTNEVPFVGNFNGRASDGISISNLNIHCAETVKDSQGNTINRAASDIGIFGYVADQDSQSNKTIIQNAKFDGLNIDLSDVTSTVASSSTTISHVNTHAGVAHVGYAVGHVHTYTNYTSTGPVNASPLYNVYVSNASVSGGAGVRSDYGYIGKVDSIDSTTPATVAGEVSALGAGTSGGNRFGGSLDMFSLYNRLRRTYNGPAVDNGSYDSITYDYDNGSITEGGKVENLSNHFSNYSNDDFSYTFNKHSNGSQDFYYLYGGLNSASGGTKTSTTYHFETKPINSSGFILSQEKNQCYFSAVYNNTTYYLVIPQQASKPAGTLSILTNSNFVTTNSADKTMFDIERSGDYYLFYTRQQIGATNYIVSLGSGSSSLYVYFSTQVQSSNTYKFSEDGSGYWKSVSTGSGKSFRFNTSNRYWALSTSGNKVDETTSSSTSYLKIENGTNLTTTLASAEAATWVIDGNKIYTKMLYDGKYYRFYLNGSSSGLAISRLSSSSSATTWSTGWSNDRLNLSFVDSATTYYLSFSKSSLVSTTSATTIRTSAGTVSGNAYEFVSEEPGATEVFPSTSFPATYMPISVSNSSIYTTASYNTGYIMSGKNYTHDTPTETARYNAGDVRVSRYGMNNIHKAMGQPTFNNSKLFAITATNNSDFALITDEYNSSSEAPSDLSAITSRKSAASLSRYNKWTEDKTEYSGARNSLKTVFEGDTTNIYGLHFMDASISPSNVLTIPNAKINGTIYSNGLEVPGDCIDFHVKQKGYIVFFAGTYFNVGNNDENDCFFSLHKVVRNSSNSITSIDEIKTIYEDNSGNLSYNPASTTGLTKVFDTAVLTNPSKTYYIPNAVYYFEIPVEAGEYALGSVSGKNGAYLMYLDISASGSQITENQEHMIDNAPLFTQIDFQTDDFVVNSCFNVAYVIPSGASKSNFSVAISCGTVTHGGNEYKCYELVIDNATGTDFLIHCLLMDNDNNPNNDYFVMYAITYNGGVRNEYLTSNSYTGESGEQSMTPTYTPS